MYSAATHICKFWLGWAQSSSALLVSPLPAPLKRRRKHDRAVTPPGLHFTLIAWENRKLRSWKMQCLYLGHIYTSTPPPPQPSFCYLIFLFVFFFDLCWFSDLLFDTSDVIVTAALPMHCCKPDSKGNVRITAVASNSNSNFAGGNQIIQANSVSK